MKLRWICVLIGSLFLSAEVFAEKWAMRAREHYEVMDFKMDSETTQYKGFTNTINIWREEPYKYSYGLALGPVLGSAKTKEDIPLLGERVRLWVFGAEAKYFPAPQVLNLYTRVGVYHHILNHKSLTLKGDPKGVGYLVSLGYEFPISSFSIAPEIAYRSLELSHQIEGKILSVSVGVHFYKK